MLGRIIEIATHNASLLQYFGHLEIRLPPVENEAAEPARIPLDDLGALVIFAFDVLITADLIKELCARGIPIIFCGDKFLPVNIMFPVNGNFEQARRIDAQLMLNKSIKDKIWQQLVISKIKAQKDVLQFLDKPGVAFLNRQASLVLEGDSSNLEGQCAKAYWKFLFGDTFIRDRSASGINAGLNYGYTIIRSAVARAISASGLHPSIGIWHKNANNAFRLADDLIEPFRQIIDLKIYQLYLEGSDFDLSKKELKKEIGLTLYLDLKLSDEITPLYECIQKLAVSFALKCLDPNSSLVLPDSIIPLDFINKRETVNDKLV